MRPRGGVDLSRIKDIGSDSRPRRSALAGAATPRTVRILARLLFLSFLAAPFLLALVPWQQTVQGQGMVIAYAPVERMQVKVTGLAPDRYVVSCNGRVMPLRPTGKVGEFVAGVRYRAWQPPNALHPTIGVHAPLTVDLVDTWLGRSMGGGQYFVAHPGGLSYETFPVNSHEAESRRLSRFVRMGHTPGGIGSHALASSALGSNASGSNASGSRAPRIDRTFPVTLDLRQ